MLSLLVQYGLLASLAAAQKPQYPPAFPPTPALPASVAYAPSVLPNVFDGTAPSAQNLCPGYKASNVKHTAAGLTADLTLADAACNVYGFDIVDLSLSVEYQSKERLAVRIVPTYLSAANQSLYILDPGLTPYPGTDNDANKAASDLRFTWSNNPSFSFKITRVSSGEVLFDTSGTVIVFEDQFLELKTSMVPNYNIYGLAESLHSFRLGDDWTQTFWASYNLPNDNVIDVNQHSTHPMYMETRYGNGNSTSHGVYARNAHGQDWLLRKNAVTYRTIGGSFDLYFLSGPTPKEVISQYHTQVIGTPYLQPYWTLGSMQVRWSYQNWTNLQAVIDLYAAANIQLEMIASDLDYLYLDRDYTHNFGHYSVAQGKAFLARLHAAGQYWFPILDPNIYAPNPNNATDVGLYPEYQRGADLSAYLRNGADYYFGVLWAGISAYVDFLVPAGMQFWTEEIVRYHKQLAFDGWWLDVSDPTSFATYSLPPSAVEMNPIHVPFALPGDPNTSVAVDYRYPEKFIVTNRTEAQSAALARASQSSAYPTPPTPTPTHARTGPTPGVRQVNFPPYAIKNDAVPGNALVKNVIAPNATHNDEYHTAEYELHNLYGHLGIKATFNGLAAARPGLRPFALARSPFAGTGSYAGHWGGDTNSKWGDMYFGISQALQNSIAGIAYFGVETCGFNGNSDFELCTRWMELSAWFPLYRNHNNRNTIPQEPYIWASTAEGTRRIMNIRYTLLPYTYTLFYQANTAGATVFTALQWEFPNDASLAAVETQFMSGPALLITPVLAPLATSVQGVFPGIGQGTIWYDWYTLAKVNAAAGQNVTMQAPLVHQPIHVRGGYILPLQQAGNTTATSRKNPWSLLVALDANQEAQGSLYLDDGVSIEQAATKNIEMSFTNNTLTATISGSYTDALPLANLTIAGITSQPRALSVQIGGRVCPAETAHFAYHDGALQITNLESVTARGIWSGDVKITLHEEGGSMKACETVAWPGNWGGGWGLVGAEEY